MEAIQRPQALAQAAELACRRGLPIVAVKAGRTESGRKAASSHTGALASEDRVIDAFFAQHGIWRAADPVELVAAGQLYLSGGRPQGKRFVAVSNSGASCVMAADAAEELGFDLPQFSAATQERLRKVLPPFATPANPLDVTGAILGNSGLFGAALPVLGEDDACDLLMLAIPVAGAGYDVPLFARDTAAFRERFGKSVAVAAPQPEVRAEFEKLGLPAFARERDAMLALRQLAAHSALLRRPPASPASARFPALPPQGGRFLDEFESLKLLAGAGIAVVEHRLCRDEHAAREAYRALGPKVVVKACSSSVPHKTEQGLVKVGVQDEDTVAALYRDFKSRIPVEDGVLVARHAAGRRELALGARLDPVFGPVVLVGDGGVYLEALKDFRLLLPPFGEEAVLAALGELRIAPLLRGVRGERPLDVGVFAQQAVKLGAAMLSAGGTIASVDINPVMLFDQGRGALAVDALVERGAAG
jgi:acyl-CoA synthetase (NDP forming)